MPLEGLCIVSLPSIDSNKSYRAETESVTDGQTDRTIH